MTTYTRPFPTALRESREVALPIHRSILMHAALLGVAGDLLMRPPVAGLGFPIWVALLALSVVALTWRNNADLAAEAGIWILTAVFFAAFVAWRSSDTLHAMNVVATLGALGMAAIALANQDAALFARRMRDTLWAAIDVLRSVIAGALPIASRVLMPSESNREAHGHARTALRAAIIASVIVLVFGSLLRSADPIFASLVQLPNVDFGEAFSHVILAGFYAWIVAGFARGAFRPERDALTVADALPFSFGLLDITTALTTLIVLFSAFLISQLGWLFGGEQFLRERTGLTAASYARAGFFQLVFVIALVLPVLMVTRAAMRGDFGLRRRHTALSLPLIALLGLTMLSAIGRMKLYVHYYGLTADRLYPLVFMAWLAVVLVWFAFTVLRDVARPFAGGALIAGAVMLAALNVSDPDAIIARMNVERAANIEGRVESALDLEYLASLGGAAVPVAVHALLTPSPLPTSDQRCDASRHLLRRWDGNSARAEAGRAIAGWRAWNADDALALRVVAANSAALRVVTHQSCTPGRRAASAYYPR